MDADIEKKLGELATALEAYRERDPEGYAATEQELARHIEAILGILEGTSS